MIFFVLLLVLVFFAQVTEFFIPPLDWMFDARVYIAPVIVFFGAMALPFPLMLALAFWAGFLLDALNVQVNGTHVEISLGSSILLYAVLAGIMHGLRPLFVRGRWEVHCIMSGLFTSALLLAQYLMLSFRRGSIVFSREVWWQIGGSGLLALLMAPLVFWSLHWLARATRFPYLSSSEVRL
ncbi:MAG: hypothetical protein M3R59_02260 [Verrucomicrobiota bacterium]|nr:hypothetical protein [Verrucomicrobiota bacterium]